MDLSAFQPTRSSTPTRAKSKSNTSHAANTTITSTTSSTLPLSALTAANVSVIDAIIHRAPETATTFLAVFKAYNEVLLEKGIDAGEDVIYYGFLLKLGVVKGKNWGERWKTVKDGLRNSSHDVSYSSPHIEAPSFLSDSNTTENDDVLDRVDTPRHSIPVPFLRTPAVRKPILKTPNLPSMPLRNTSSTALPITPAYQHRIPSRRQPLPFLQVSPSSDSELSYTGQPPIGLEHDNDDDSMNDDGHDQPFSKPPSYRTFAPDYNRKAVNSPKSKPRLHPALPNSPPRPSSAKGRIEQQRPQAPIIAKDEKGVNGHDFWQVADMERDADDFRQEMLLRHCWGIWKTGLNWIVTTSHQVAEAREHLLLRSCFFDWLSAFRSHVDLSKRVEYVDDTRRLRFAFRTWQQAIEEKRRHELREGVKRRFLLIRSSVETRIKRAAFKRWILAFGFLRFHVAHEINVQRDALARWYEHLQDVRRLSALVIEFQQESYRFSLIKSLDVWRRRVDLRLGERAVLHIVAKRSIGEAWEMWSRATKLHRLARGFNSRHLLKTIFYRWRSKLARVQALTRRVNTRIHRKDALLLRAVLRVWVAKERGELLERVQRTRLGVRVFRAWESRLHTIRELESQVITITNRHAHTLISRAYAAWRSRTIANGNALIIAQTHLTHHLLAHAFQVWCSRRQSELRRVKQARIARRWFLKRTYWSLWRGALDDRAREKRFAKWNSNVLRRYFVQWRESAQRQQQHRTLADIVESKRYLREQGSALRVWMNKVVDIREGMMRVQQMANSRLKRNMLSKWIEVYVRHGDNLALMQSFQDVKREDLLRKLLLYWNQVARTSIHRRERLRQREEEMRQAITVAAWERWRDRFLEESLRGVELDVHRQLQANLLFRTFRSWEGRTYSIPAVRLYAKRTKIKTLQKWLQALPQAQLKRKGREREKQSVLKRAFGRWLVAYRAKMTLKAVARARYLRLPTSTPSTRTTLMPHPFTSRALPASIAKPRPIFPSMIPSTSTQMPLVPTTVVPKSRRLGRSPSPSRIDRPISTTHSATAVLSTTKVGMAFPSHRGKREIRTDRHPDYDDGDTKGRVPFPLLHVARRSPLNLHKAHVQAPIEPSSAPVSTTGGDERGREKIRAEVGGRVVLRSSSVGGVDRRGRLSFELRRNGVEGVRKGD